MCMVLGNVLCDLDPNVKMKDTFEIVYHRLQSYSILMDFKNAKLTSLYIFQKTVVCKIPLLR